jgi:nitrite reductase/ring-hydroxylating ferredoxin subunit
MKSVVVAQTSQIQEGQVLPVKVEDRKILLAKVDGKIYALDNKCPHLGMPIAKGKVCDGAITCPWHGATYSLATGENLKWVDSFAGIPLPQWSHAAIAMGKQPQGIKTYSATEQGEDISIAI